MTSHPEPCESRGEAISLLAAGCLSADETAALREHLRECAACRRRHDELMLVCARLTAAAPAGAGPLGDGDVIRRIGRRIEPEVGTVERTRSTPRGGGQVAALALGRFFLRTVVAAVVRRPVDEHGSAVPPVVGDNTGRGSPGRDVPGPSIEEEVPTLLVLRRAAAESDESLDRILARSVRSSEAPPLSPHTYWKEVIE